MTTDTVPLPLDDFEYLVTSRALTASDNMSTPHTGSVEHPDWQPSHHDDDAILPMQSLNSDHPPSNLKPCTSSSASSPSSAAFIPTLSATSPETFITTFKRQSGHFFLIILPLSLVMGVITADMSNLDFVHLVELKVPVPIDDMTLPTTNVLNNNLLRWTLLQSAYLLPIMLFAGAIMVLEFVLLVGRLRPSRLADGLCSTLVVTVLVVGIMTLLNAFVATSVVGVIFTRMCASLFVCSALGLIAQAVELLPAQIHGSHQNRSTVLPAATGFDTIMFATVYGLGTAFASCSTFAGYQLANLLQRNGVSFQGISHGPTQGFRGIFLLEGLFILALAPVIAILLFLSRRLRRRNTLDSSTSIDTTALHGLHPLPRISEDPPDINQLKTTHTFQSSIKSNPAAPPDSKPIITTTSEPDKSISINDNDNDNDGEEDCKNENPMFASLRRFSSYCASPLANVAILNRNNGDGGVSSVAANIRTLQRFHSGFGLWVSSILRRIMVYIYGRMGVDSGAFDLISAGTSSRETFICGVLIVSNTVIVQLAVISLIAPLNAPDAVQAMAKDGVKVVPTLPGLPTLAGGVSGAISSVLWSIWATKSSTRGVGAHNRVQQWKDKPWWVPTLLTSCLVITLFGLALAVVASIMVPQGDCDAWIIYLATTVTYAGSIPQLPLALLQIYTVLDAELGRNPPFSPFTPLQASSEVAVQPADRARFAARTASPSVQAVKWERIGVMISTLTTIAGSELLTAWVFLMPDAAQKAFLFTSVVLAVGGCVWLMFRHTWPLRRSRKVAAGRGG
ncbi:uncharacterized protein UTRI_10258 [Ustilago trichophora]|uniref:Uncharacterized protein n=1 Tax=Ustilago trichophora TaxID=86804 RepID=A0A5C3EK48_9BASI|nr:uncharacterized protein UTRI_10258 [Ustilago trichophora]